MLSLSPLFSMPQEKLKPRDLPQNYRSWLEEEVIYLITGVERDIFLQLQTNRERDLFIEAFWKQRDPTQGTDMNEFREEHYKRFKHANTRFISAGKPGWKTDRGKVYIILGKPWDVRIFDGLDTYFPCEAWYYQNMGSTGLPQAFNLVFYQKGRIGDFKIYNPGMEGPWSLLSDYQNWQGDYEGAYYYLMDMEPELAHLSISLIPGESIHQFPSMASSTFLHNIDRAAINKIKDQYARKFIQYKDIVEVEYSANYIDNYSQVRIVRDPSGTQFVHFSIEPANLSMGRYENSIYTNLEFTGMITDGTGKTIFQFDREFPLRFSEEQFNNMKQRPFAFTDKFPLIPGEYQFSLLMKNSVSKEFSSFEKNILIEADPSSPRLSPLLLGFNTTRPSTEKHLRNPFVFSGVQIYSHPRNSFVREDNLSVYLQLLNASENLLETGTIKYVIKKEDEAVRSVTRPLSRYQGGFDCLETFPLEDVPPGYYTMNVSLQDGGGNELFRQKENFEVSMRSSIPRPWIMANYMIESSDAHNLYVLGIEHLNTGNYDSALTLLERAYRAAPEHPDYGLQFAKANYYNNRYQQALDILLTLTDRLSNDYDLNWITGKSYQALSRFDMAIQTFSDALNQFGVNTALLNSLGDCQAEIGNREEAIAAYEKSLEIDAKQEDIRIKLEGLKKRPILQ